MGDEKCGLKSVRGAVVCAIVAHSRRMKKSARFNWCRPVGAAMTEMVIITKRLGVLLFLLGWCLAFSAGQAQETKGKAVEPPAETAAPIVTEEAVNQIIEETKADPGLDETAKAAVVKDLEGAIASVKAAATHLARMEAYRRDVTEAPGEIGRIRTELAARQSGAAAKGLPTDPLPAKDAPPETVTARLSAETARVADAGRALRELEDQLAALESRPTEIRDRLIEARRLSAEAQAAEAVWSSRKAVTPREKAEKAVVQATALVLRREIESLDQELLSLELRRGLQEARRDLAASDLTVLRDRAKALEDRARASASARIGEAERLIAESELSAISDHEPVRHLVEETKRLSTEAQQALDKIRVADTALQTAETELDRLRRDGENLRAQIEIGGMEESFAHAVPELMRELPRAGDFSARAEERRKSIAAARLAAYRSQRELESLPSAETQLEELLTSLRFAGLEEAMVAKLKPVLESLVATHRRLLSDYSDGNRRLSRQLGEVELVESETISLSKELGDYLGEKLLWVASSPPIGWSAITGVGPALREMAGPGMWRGLASSLTQVEWPTWTLLVATVLLLFAPRSKVKRFLSDSALRTRRISRDGIGNTMQAILATAFLAAPLPLLLGWGGRLLLNETPGSSTAYPLGQALTAGGFMLSLFGLRFAAWLCRPSGVGEAHFGWPRELVERMRRFLRQATIIYPPAVGLLGYWLNHEDPAHFQGIGRLVFLFSMVLISVILWRLLSGPESVYVRPGRPVHWLIRLRRFWVPLVAGVPLALAVLAAAGHFLTAVALAYQFQNTALVLLVCLVLHGTLSRWAMLKERRLALREALAEREARLAAARAEGPPSVEAPVASELSLALDEDEDLPDLEEVGDQTRRLIASVVTVLGLLATWVIWSEAIPVLRYLDSRMLFGSISIADVLLLGLIGMIISVVFRNLPGLLEVAFLRALELESGSRNAIVTICQYLTIAIGAAVAFHTLGLDWSQFGWIAAALSVGLGFGLQEVVTNFVSGLILLLERPIRVGDIVTVAGVDGVVSRIRLRATTITNWDRKEFVVPNKEFVTGTLLNWTLSSSVTRLVIPVGVAYGSDTAKVQKLLVEIATSHPEVLPDPAPQAVFELFGDSTLNFTVRCFLPSPAERLDATHYINSEIHRRFAEAGIEISYPQRDLHIRSVHPSVPWPPPGEGGR